MRIELALLSTITLFALPAFAQHPAAKQTQDPALGKTTFTVYDSFMSPTQQPGEETDAPKALAKAFGLESTGVSTPREERKSMGYGKLRFARDLSKLYVDVQIAGVNPADILMFHIHCGLPGVLGPIVVDFGQYGTLSKTLANNALSVEVKNANLTFVTDMPHGIKAAPPEGCPVDPAMLGQVKTIAGLESLARKGVLYFNLHTKAHTFYGEMRGQIYVAPAN